MNCRRIVAVAAFAFSLAFAGGRLLADPDALEGKPAPAVSVKTIDGKAVKLSDMKGKVVVMDFWATWCPPCRKSLPHVQEISANKALADKGLVVWAVNAHEQPAVVKKFLAENKFTFTVPMGTAQAMQQYQISGIPTTIVVGRDGNVAKAFVGFGEGSGKALDEAIEAALAKK
jgi:thiol-disulfide isomerase/thioredoxin